VRILRKLEEEIILRCREIIVLDIIMIFIEKLLFLRLI